LSPRAAADAGNQDRPQGSQNCGRIVASSPEKPGKPAKKHNPALQGQYFRSINVAAPSGLSRTPEFLVFLLESNKGFGVSKASASRLDKFTVRKRNEQERSGWRRRRQSDDHQGTGR